MDRISPFSGQHLEAVCKVLGNNHYGLVSSEIGSLLQECGLNDVSRELTRWKRLYYSLAGAQNTYKVGNHVIMIINRALNPVTYSRDWEKFDWRVIELNDVLSFSGFGVRQDGKVIRTPQESTIKRTQDRAGAIRGALEDRGAHPEILSHCCEVLVAKNYFRAVTEAIERVAERVRNLSGTTADGVELIYLTFSVQAPILTINSLETEAEISEQKGFVHILVGLFDAVRSPTEATSNVRWPITEEDALDILSLVSFVHRKLDGAIRI